MVADAGYLRYHFVILFDILACIPALILIAFVHLEQHLIHELLSKLVLQLQLVIFRCSKLLIYLVCCARLGNFLFNSLQRLLIVLISIDLIVDAEAISFLHQCIFHV